MAVRASVLFDATAEMLFGMAALMYDARDRAMLVQAAEIQSTNAEEALLMEAP